MKRKGLWIALAVVVVGLVGGCGKEEIPRPEVLRLGEDHLDRASAYMEKDEDEKAIEELTKAISLESNSAEKMIKVEAYLLRGGAYLFKGLDELEEHLDRGLAHNEKDEIDKAIEELTKAISLESSHEKNDRYGHRGFQ
jgi:tetratricopeptide (TPR) repeat protein